MSKDYSKFINRPGYQAPAGYDPSRYPSQSATTDIVIFSFFEGRLWVLLVKRKKMPFQGYWAIPGGFVNQDEDLEDSARRELFEETELKNLKLYEFGGFGHPKRDPRTRTITIGYLALVRRDKVKPKAGDDAEEVGWFLAKRPPELAFDHILVLKKARERLKELALLTPAVFELLPGTFTAEQFAGLCKELFGKSYKLGWILKILLAQKWVKKTGPDRYYFERKNFTPLILFLNKK